MGYTIQDGRAFRMKGVMSSVESQERLHVQHQRNQSNMSDARCGVPAVSGVTHPLTTRPTKYRNKPCIAEGLRFDSIHEAEVWLALRALEHGRRIEDLHRQVPWELYAADISTPTPVFTPIAKYIADFQYRDSDTHRLHVLDAKSPITRKNQTYRLKCKWFAACYGIAIEEV